MTDTGGQSPDTANALPPPEADAPTQPNLRDNLQEAWRAQPAFRLLVILLPVIAVAMIAFGLLSGGQEEAPTSLAPGGTLVEDVPGSEGLSPVMEQAILQEDQQRLFSAIEQGEAFLPTPIDRAEPLDGEAEQSMQAEDPLAFFRERLEQDQEPVAPPPVIEPPQQGPDNQALAEAMRRQMETLFRSWAPTRATVLQVAGPDPSPEGAVEGAAGEQVAQAEPAADDAPQGRALVPAGSVLYGQMLTEADSSVPGPVLATIVSPGPLQGARIIGAFSATEDYLVITFSNAVVGETEYAINAVALDPDTTLAGVATDVDRRYFERVLLPAAAAFIAGVGEAFAQQDTQVVVSGDVVIEDRESLDTQEQIAVGVAAAAESVAEIVGDAGSGAEPIIRVARGTPIGLFFTETLREGAEGGS